jgi:hypothetical protein
LRHLANLGKSGGKRILCELLWDVRGSLGF